MRSISRLVNTFDLRIRHSVDGVKMLEEAMKGFDLQDKIPNKIELVANKDTLRRNMRLIVSELNEDPNITTLFMRVNEGLLKETTENWIGKLRRGTRIKRLPLRISEGILKETVNKFIEKANRGRAGIERLNIKGDLVELRGRQATAMDETQNKEVLSLLTEISGKLSSGGRSVTELVSDLITEGVKLRFF
jgi:hypothetical protein